ncbi:hypothetical protein F4778DRAFT_783102 [Xylariomycetidae sp. FL2044]|nr:hypothetical protein F4778DRAFT_783102 [Xylariomycetidae sp. FL2044]
MGFQGGRRKTKPKEPARRAPKKYVDKYPVRAADHLFARVIQDEDEYQASLSEAAKQTERHILKEIAASEAISSRSSGVGSTKTGSSSSTTYLSPNTPSRPPTSPAKRTRAAAREDSSDDEPVFLYSSPVKKLRRESTTKQAPTTARPVKQAVRRGMTIRQSRSLAKLSVPVYDEPEYSDDEEKKEEEPHVDRSLKTHKPSKTMEDDFAKLKVTMRDPRYLHLFQQ